MHSLAISRPFGDLPLVNTRAVGQPRLAEVVLLQSLDAAIKGNVVRYATTNSITRATYRRSGSNGRREKSHRFVPDAYDGSESIDWTLLEKLVNGVLFCSAIPVENGAIG